MKTTKRVLSIAIIFMLGLGLFSPATVAFEDFPRGELPDWVDLREHRRTYYIVSGAVLGLRETSFAMLYDDELVYESYRHGFDEYTMHPMNSFTKSFLNAVIGAAIQDGYIDSCLQQKVYNFFPDAYIAEGQESKREMTLEHILTMRSGLPWLTQRSSLDFMQCEVDSGLAAFETPQRIPPGIRWSYCGGPSMQILVAIIERSTGRDFYDYVHERIFGPLGMSSAEWRIFTADGRPTGAMGLYMTTRDMLRFGQLYLHDGVWEGRRILPEGWVDQTWDGETFAVPFGAPWGLLNYNLLWWGNTFSQSAGESFRAQGFAGMLVSVYRDSNLVVARTGGIGIIGSGEAAWPLILNPETNRHLYIIPRIDRRFLPSWRIYQNRVACITTEILEENCYETYS